MFREWWFWVIILVVVLLLFGTTRLPGLAKSMGESMRVFRKEVKGLGDDAKAEEAQKAAATPAKSETPPDTKS